MSHPVSPLRGDHVRPWQTRWRVKMRYGLLWLLGVPIPVLILIYFLFN
ncbi:hypothetical protein [Dongia sp.]